MEAEQPGRVLRKSLWGCILAYRQYLLSDWRNHGRTAGLFPLALVLCRLEYPDRPGFCAVSMELFGVVYFSRLSVVAGGATMQRNLDFSSAIRLWSAEVIDNPKDFLGWQDLGNSLFSAGEMEEADRAYRWMLEFAPEYHGGLRTRTAFFLQQKMYEEALPTAHKAYAKSQKDGDLYAQAFDGLDLAAVYLGLGKCDQALTYLDGPVQPLQGQLNYVDLRSAVLVCLGRDAEVVEEMGRADNFLSSRLRYRYGLSLYRLGRLDDARRQLEAAVKDEESGDAWNLLGAIYAQQNDRAASQRAFSRAIELQPDRREYQQNQLQLQPGDAGQQ